MRITDDTQQDPCPQAKKVFVSHSHKFLKFVNENKSSQNQFSFSIPNLIKLFSNYPWSYVELILCNSFAFLELFNLLVECIQMKRIYQLNNTWLSYIFFYLDVHCLEEDGCRYWTYNTYTKICYLKTSDVNEKDSTGSISGSVGCSVGNT